MGPGHQSKRLVPRGVRGIDVKGGEVSVGKALYFKAFRIYGCKAHQTKTKFLRFVGISP